MQADEEIMNLLAADDLWGSCRLAAARAGCDHHTVAHDVALREQGRAPTTRPRRARSIAPYLAKVEAWVARRHGKRRADVAQDTLEALGDTGAARTTRRAVAAVKAAYQRGERRRWRPWRPEPGVWRQWDDSDGPRVEDRPTWRCCAWLAWSRYRVVLPLRDKRLPTVLACLDTTFRRLGGVPTSALTDNEKTVTVEPIAGIPVRQPELAAFGRDDGLTMAQGAPDRCAGRPAKHGRRGGHRAQRPGGSGAHRRAPAPVVFPLRCAARGRRRLVRPGQRPPGAPWAIAPRAAPPTNDWPTRGGAGTRCRRRPPPRSSA